MYVPRLRRIPNAVKEIKAADPQSEITYSLIKELVTSGKITTMKYGNAWLVNLDELYAYLKGVKK